MIACKECGAECSAPNALGYHLRNHGMTYEEYVIKHEHSNIRPTCLTCQTPLKIKKGGFSTFCSRRCAVSGEHNGMHGLKGPDSPNAGKVRTDEMKKRYSKAAKQRWVDIGDRVRQTFKTDDYRKMQSEAQKNSYKTKPEQRQKRIDAVNAFWASDSDETKQARKEASERAILLLEQGKIGPQAPFKAEWKFNPFTFKDEYMHSSWEAAFLEKCIKDDYPVTKAHNLRIPYVDNGVNRTYIPDFVALSENVVFEIKGLLRENDPLKLMALELWAAQNQFKVVFIDYEV